ncbi:hypothetical protein Q5H92_14240 [Hymenobacter sp. M29]|uniref:8-amino-7-oxononanoate synthase n=1 Tax=Hymenobacter mellowenesis TaxID=3063995 RepID=A0ABT9ACF7_9BACT|nr:hypothetical protein [Hymenobacter sp. M29]MDO7847525.1 hypothetical protein [Hymenobacter sp. M29]
MESNQPTSKSGFPLQGALAFTSPAIKLGDDTALELKLSAAGNASLATLLGSGGSLTLEFKPEGDPGPRLEQSFTYSIKNRQIELQRDPSDPDLPYCSPMQTDGNRFAISNNVAVLKWRLNNWREAGGFVVRGRLLADRPLKNEEYAVGLEISEVRLRVRSKVIDVPAPAPTPTPTPNPPPPPASGPAVVAPLPLPVTLFQAQREPSDDQFLWGLIRRRTVNFNKYCNFIDNVLTDRNSALGAQARASIASRQLPFSRSASYTLLKYATEFYLMQEAGLAPGTGFGDPNPQWAADELRRTGGVPFDLEELRDDYLENLGTEESKVLVVPYFESIREKLKEVPLKDPDDLITGGTLTYGILKSRVQGAPLMELIWSYWHEEGGLVQTMNALSLRFQNVRRPGPGPDPLANLAIDPLRPLNNIIWGYIEDERNRLTLNRRNLEYQYEYGFGLIGRGVQNIAVAEHRTFFLRGFHSLLRACTEFYQQANFTTVIPDGFPILNHLREVHLTLAEGAHNQYGDLPWTARAEMLTQQWILARPEVREFLGGRVMVPYTEPWMDRVDNMKSLQGWNPTNITHFRDLGAFGEQLLLSIRYGSWNSPTVGATSAANWAHYWREEIQRYIHAYKAVTGIDLATDLGDIRQNTPDNEERFLQPAQLIERQNALNQGQLRRSRQLNGPLAPRRPYAVPAPRRRLLDE